MSVFSRRAQGLRQSMLVKPKMLSITVLISLLLTPFTSLYSAPAQATLWHSLPAPAGQTLQVSIQGAKVSTTQLKQLQQWLQQQWQLLDDRSYWPLAQQFADSRQWPANAALLAQAWQQCEQWWQQQRSYHCRFGVARQQWQALLANNFDKMPADAASNNLTATVPNRVVARRQARQWLQEPASVLPDLQQLATALLLDQLWQQCQQLWPAAQQLRLQFNDWQAVQGQAQALTLAGNTSQPLQQITLANAVLLRSNVAPHANTAAGRYSPVWLPTEAWPVPTGPVVTVVADSFSQAWLQAQALVAASPTQRRQLQKQPELMALWQAVATNRSADIQVTERWYALTQDPQLHQADQLQLQLQLPDHGAGSKRPFVSVWLQNSSGLHQQILLLGDQPRWYNELRSWWRLFKQQLPAGPLEQQQQQIQQLADQWAGATRKAGPHHFQWVARLANGTPLPPGPYQLMVEIAREGGGREQLKLPLHWPLPAGQIIQAHGKQEVALVQLQQLSR